VEAGTAPKTTADILLNPTLLNLLSPTPLNLLNHTLNISSHPLSSMEATLHKDMALNKVDTVAASATPRLRLLLTATLTLPHNSTIKAMDSLRRSQMAILVCDIHF
jgi:hypothetical protein